MKIKDISDLISNYHLQLKSNMICDGYRCGNIDGEVKGIVTTCCASVEVIKNLLPSVQT